MNVKDISILSTFLCLRPLNLALFQAEFNIPVSKVAHLNVFFKQALKSDRLFCFRFPFSVAREKVQCRAKNNVILKLIITITNFLKFYQCITIGQSNRTVGVNQISEV